MAFESSNGPLCGSLDLANSCAVIAIARPSGANHTYSNARPVGLWEDIEVRLWVDSRAEHNVNRVTVKAVNSNICRNGRDIRRENGAYWPRFILGLQTDTGEAATLQTGAVA